MEKMGILGKLSRIFRFSIPYKDIFPFVTIGKKRKMVSSLKCVFDY